MGDEAPSFTDRDFSLCDLNELILVSHFWVEAKKWNKILSALIWLRDFRRNGKFVHTWTVCTTSDLLFSNVLCMKKTEYGFQLVKKMRSMCVSNAWTMRRKSMHKTEVGKSAFSICITNSWNSVISYLFVKIAHYKPVTKAMSWMDQEHQSEECESEKMRYRFAWIFMQSSD